MAGRRERADQILVRHAAGKHSIQRTRRSHQAALADRARLPGAQAGTRTRPLRGTRLARLSPSRDTVHRRLRLPDLREGDDSPLRTMCHPETPAACRSRRLPIQRRRRSGPNDTSQTRSPPCDDVSPSPSRGASFDVHAATRPAEPMKDAYDAVRLTIVELSTSLKRTPNWCLQPNMRHSYYSRITRWRSKDTSSTD